MSLKIEHALWLQQPHELQTAGASRRRPVVALVWIDEEKMPFVRVWYVSGVSVRDGSFLN